MWIMVIEKSIQDFIFISSYITLSIAILFALYVWYKQKFSRTYLWFIGSFILAIISLSIWTTVVYGPVPLEPELVDLPGEDSPEIIIATVLWIFSMLMLLIGIAKKK